MSNERAAVNDVLVQEFSRDVRKLSKKYHHFETDLERALKVITVDPFTSNSERISDLGENVHIPIFKLKKFRSIDIRNKGAKSGFRLIYAFDPEENTVFLIEVYNKNKKPNHDVNRIKKYFEIKDEETFEEPYQAS